MMANKGLSTSNNEAEELNHSSSTNLTTTSGVKLTKTQLIDWPTLCASIVLILSSALLLANSSCSKPHGLAADDPVCVGGQLSIQVWLAIIGVEFSIAGSFLLPRLLSIALSKSLTSAAISKGVPLAKLLNSQSTAPIVTQVRRGWKRVFTVRAIVSLLVVAVTVLYKFSFVQVNLYGTMQVAADWVEMGSSPNIPGQCSQKTYLGMWPGDESVFNCNYRDLVSESRNSILYTGPRWVANETSGPSTFYMGPAINVTSVPQLLNGTVSRCVPAGFTKFTLSTTPAPSTWSAAFAPFAGSAQLSVNLYSPRSLAFRGSANGSLSILPFTRIVYQNGSFGQDPQYGSDYDFIVTAQIEDCWGNFSWTNVGGYQVFQMNEPVDTSCTFRDTTYLTAEFNRSQTNPYVTSIIQAYFSGRPSYIPSEMWDYSKATRDLRREIELFLLALPVSLSGVVAPAPSDSRPTPSNPTLKALCDKSVKEYNDGSCPYAASNVAFITGTIDKRGVGMTPLGMALQAVILLLSLVTLFVLLGPGLPILTEWSAQWLGLAAGRLPVGEVVTDVAGTSAGRGHVKDQALPIVYVSSVAGPDNQQETFLKLTKERGKVFRDLEHL